MRRRRRRRKVQDKGDPATKLTFVGLLRLGVMLVVPASSVNSPNIAMRHSTPFLRGENQGSEKKTTHPSSKLTQSWDLNPSLQVLRR